MRLRPHILRFALGTGSLAVPMLCHAQGLSGFADWLLEFLTGQFLIAISGVIFLFLLYYGGQLIINSQDENSISTTRKSIVYAVLGFGVLAIMFPLARVFSLHLVIFGTPAVPFDITQVTPSLEGLLLFSVFIAKGTFVLIATYHGLRMMTAQGDEGVVSSARKALLNNIIAVVLLQISDTIVRSVVLNKPVEIASEIAGLAGFIMMLIGVASFVALIVAGIMLIVSTNDSLKDKAKQTVLITIVSIVVCLLSYVFLTIVAFPNV